jgi:Mn-dependent DtxR family transcriptional regulator
MENKGVKVIAQQSHEDYLETILMVSKEKEFVRSVDLANVLNYSRASVAVALKKLKEEDFIFVDEKNHIFLTQKGLKRAEKVFYRHEILTKYLIKIGVNPLTAEEDACTIEHVISEETFEAIEKELKNER